MFLVLSMNYKLVSVLSIFHNFVAFKKLMILKEMVMTVKRNIRN